MIDESMEEESRRHDDVLRSYSKKFRSLISILEASIVEDSLRRKHNLIKSVIADLKDFIQ